MDNAELNKRFEDIHDLLGALRENVELLNRIGSSFNALIELLIAKDLIEAEELLPRIEAKLKEYKQSKAKHSKELLDSEPEEPFSPN